MYDPLQEYDSGQNGESPFKPPTYWQLIRSLWSEEFSEQKIISSFEVRFSSISNIYCFSKEISQRLKRHQELKSYCPINKRRCKIICLYQTTNIILMF